VNIDTGPPKLVVGNIKAKTKQRVRYGAVIGDDCAKIAPQRSIFVI
jgi:hypothetical protein